MELILPNNYIEIEQEEMMYLDGGGLYFDKGSVRTLAFAMVGTAPLTIYGMVAGFKWIVNTLTIKLGAILGGFVGALIGKAVGALILKSAYNVCEKLYTAAFYNKGVEFSFGVEWGIIPVIEGTVR